MDDFKIDRYQDDISDIIDDDYCRTVSEAYWAEEEEYRLGIHPEQIKERIKKELGKGSYKITSLDWKYGISRVGVYIDNEFYGVFNYKENKFYNTPNDRFRFY